jgi:hypothetical protein
VLDGAREADCSASVGVVDASIEDPGVGDATSEGERDGNTVVYSVFVMTTRDEEFAMSEADVEGSTATDEPPIVAEAVGVPGVSSAAEVDVWMADLITEDALKTAELAVLFAVCGPWGADPGWLKPGSPPELEAGTVLVGIAGADSRVVDVSDSMGE